ncbi:MAG: phenylalanine--tRNA ligase subunit beta [Bacteroidales bacterium]|nr:phenylalanine--tRNA ligase subunit beta [Bacteroidales bacterium]
MRISYNWLKEYININLPEKEVADILTNIGLEVESIEKFETVKGGLEGIVIGEVISCEKHPNADKLSLTKVNIGQSKPLQIICGAPNVAVGQKVPVALIGTTLYKGKKYYSIQKKKFTGEFSEGMICAEDELGLGDDHDGIMVLDSNAKPGTLAKEYFKIETDTVFEIGLTPNRIDASSHYGVARDLAAFLSDKKNITLMKPSVDKLKINNTDYVIDVKIENCKSCPRYSGISVTGVNVKPSPFWMQNRLKAIGLNPINNVVDITNYILHETGQPLHAFDADKLKGRQIIIKNLPEGTIYTALDEIERKLSDEDLMICDSDGPVALAGVMGGLETGVTDDTVNVFIESAHFNPVSVRRTSKRHGLNTDSSFRFERGVDPHGTVYAMKRAALLMQELAGGNISSDVIDIYPKKINNKKVKLSYDHTKRLIGKKIDKRKIKKILKSLDFIIEKKTQKELQLIVPAYRYDVTREADVIEEILRIYGYNNVEISKKIYSTISHPPKPDPEKVINLISDYLTSIGFYEIISNSLTKSSYYEHIKEFKKENLVNILNPVSADLNAMRQTLLFNGLEAIIYNKNRKNHNLKFYEFGYEYYFRKKENISDIQKNYEEEKNLAILMTGQRFETNWITKQEQLSFYDIKTYTENIISRLGIDIEQVEQNYIKNEIFNEGLEYQINNKKIANLGEINDNLLRLFDIDTPVYYADLKWDILLQLINTIKIEFEPLAKYPEVKRDLALLINKNIQFKQIQKLALQTEKKLLKKVSLFDVYEGENIEKGKKSYAVSFILQDENKTLTDKQIDKIMSNFIQVYENELGAKIR